MFGIPPPGGGAHGEHGKEHRQLATIIAVVAAFLLAPTLHRYSVDWVIGIARQTYPPDFMETVYWAWFGVVHLLTFAAIRAPVFAALTASTAYFAGRFVF